MLKRIGDEPLFVSIEEAKRRIRFEGEANEERQDIELLIRAAVRRVEKRTGRILAFGQIEATFDRWEGCFHIPAAPVRVISEVAYIGDDHAEHIVAPEDWFARISDRDAHVLTVSGFTGPALSTGDPRVIIRFDAGYNIPDTSGSGDDLDLVRNPMDVQAVLMLVAHWYRHREAVADSTLATVPNGFDDLIAEQRIYR